LNWLKKSATKLKIFFSLFPGWLKREITEKKLVGINFALGPWENVRKWMGQSPILYIFPFYICKLILLILNLIIEKIHQIQIRKNVNKFWGEEGNIFFYVCIVFNDKCVEEMRQIDEEK
jgi:hypothetical protein